MRLSLRFFILVLVFASFVVKANEMRPCFLQVKALDEQNYDVIWKVPVNKKGQKLALNVRFDSHVKSTSKSQGIIVGDSYIQNWQINANKGLANSVVEINGLSSSSTEILLRVVGQDGAVTTAKINPSNPKYTFLARVGKWATVKTYLQLGIEHILNGFDHLLFVACLVLIARTFRRLLWTITGFTVAHSITLILAAIDVVRLPLPPIEASIALSIVFLALEIVKGNRSGLTYKYPIAISSGFGLLHGFGFASALNEIGLPQTELTTALLSFNIGVEVGQILFVSSIFLLIGLSKLLFKSLNIQQLETFIAYTIGSIAMYWSIDRIISFF